MLLIRLVILLPALVLGTEGNLLQNAEAVSEWIAKHRRALHRIPELMFKEELTSKYIRGVLDDLEIRYRYPVAITGIVAEIGTGKPPMVLLRSDMDALPIKEPEGLEYRSETEGVMHACGHDGHMSMLLGAAKLLKE